MGVSRKLNLRYRTLVLNWHPCHSSGPLLTACEYFSDVGFDLSSEFFFHHIIKLPCYPYEFWLAFWLYFPRILFLNLDLLFGSSPSFYRLHLPTYFTMQCLAHISLSLFLLSLWDLWYLRLFNINNLTSTETDGPLDTITCLPSCIAKSSSTDMVNGSSTSSAAEFN